MIFILMFLVAIALIVMLLATVADDALPSLLHHQRAVVTFPRPRRLILGCPDSGDWFNPG